MAVVLSILNFSLCRKINFKKYVNKYIEIEKKENRGAKHLPTTDTD